MQTFLPYSDFSLTAKCLDNKRLGKQRVEAFQILKILIGNAKKNKYGKIAWENHPAVKMWKGYEQLLFVYLLTICNEWCLRGYKDTIKIKSINIVKDNVLFADFFDKSSELTKPTWLDNEMFHASHRSNLLRKNREYYSKFNWSEPDTLRYFWPTKESV